MISVRSAEAHRRRSLTLRLLRTLVLGVSVALGISAAHTPARAQVAPAPDALQAARELISLTSGGVISDLVNNLTNQVWPAVEAGLRIKNPKIDAQTLAELRREFDSLQISAITESINDAAPIYARLFTVDELRAIIAFYRSPTGSKALRVVPQASGELISHIAPRMQVLSATVNQRFATILYQRGYIP
jgi:hypothetical protein